MPDPTDSVFSPVDHMLYVTNYWDGTATKFNPVTNSIVSTISLGQLSGSCVCPLAIAVNSVNGLIYVGGTKYGGTAPQYSVFVVNPSTGTIVSTINVYFPVGGLAFNQVNNMLYVALPQNTQLDRVSVIDTTTNTLVSNIIVDPAPFGVTVNPSNGMVYVASEHARVTAITSSNVVASSIIPPTVGSNLLGPHGIVFNICTRLDAQHSIGNIYESTSHAAYFIYLQT
jgi:YVTN family beta-propeller protein